MKLKNLFLCLGSALLALPAFGQGLPTGTLSGRISSDSQALPGTTVTVTSPSLQGPRTVTSNSNGDYNVPLLPPGEYQVKAELQGFQVQERSIKISAAQSSTLNIALSLEGVAETIEVVGNYETISATAQSATTYSKSFIESLPIERNVRETTLLSPGVNDNGPGAGISISGAQSYESLFLVNGVVVNENLRGQPLNLFIEDAIEETTTSVSGISAEYGRFTGGVVNTITKSGGNELSGSFRTNFTNDKWVDTTPVTTAKRIDKNNKRYEATLGGWIFKDRLWYFLAGRDAETSGSAQTTTTRIPFVTGVDQQRLEGKVTVSPFEGHRLVGSYIKVEQKDLGNIFNTVLDLDSVYDRETPQKLQALNYTGIVTDNFFVEAQYSKREFTFIDSGSKFTDLVKGTLLLDNTTRFRYNSPTFCGVCRPEERNNENILGKASWFLSTSNLGSHDLAFGYDTYDDIRVADNHQSGSDYRIFVSQAVITGQNITTQVRPCDIAPNGSLSCSTRIQWNPIAISSRGTSFKTNSFYVNDRWRLNEQWAFNVGARYDKNDGQDGQGKTVADDSKISPRLSATFDPKGDGNWVFNLNYAVYVNALANSQGDSTSQGGNPAEFIWGYNGPAYNVSGPAIPTSQVITNIFNWFNSVGGTNNTSVLLSVDIPGGTTKILDGLVSPSTEEISLGVAKRLGNRGIARVDLVTREGQDFYSLRTDLTTGRAIANGSPADLTLLENSDSGLSRTYRALLTQFQYRIADRINLGGVWTFSKTEGNVNGENAASGPIAATAQQFPQYKQARWNNPEGYLSTDQRHRIRLWGTWDIFRTDHHQLTLGVLENYQTGTPYGAQGFVNSAAFVTNPGYVRPPAASSVAYWFTARDAFRTDDITATDLTLNYAFRWNAFNQRIEVFLQPEVLNVFGEDGRVIVNTAVSDATTTSTLSTFNPFTQTPVEGVNWRKGTNFSKATSPTSYQTPRTFRFSVGFRF
jgi:hypothetical protein